MSRAATTATVKRHIINENISILYSILALMTKEAVEQLIICFF